MLGLRQFFSYFGSKTTLAKEYPCPKYDLIIEPFAGSAGYACRHYEKDVFLWDKDPTIVGIWKYLISAKSSDILSLPLEEKDIANLSNPEKDFIGFWFSRCNTKPLIRRNAWGRSGKYPHSFWSESTRKRISDQVEKVSHWKIFLGSYSEIPNTEGTWFIDPPYFAAGKRYKMGSSGIDYPHLAWFCRDRLGQVIVCEEASADWLPFSPLKIIRNNRNRVFSEGVYIA